MSAFSHLTEAEAHYCLSRAYVPEHIPGMMAAISGAEAFLIEDTLGFAKNNWIIYIGYPLECSFDPQVCDQRITYLLEVHQPDYLWFVGPEIPPGLKKACKKRQKDQYLHIELREWSMKTSLGRALKRAAKQLTIVHSGEWTAEHQVLVEELMVRIRLPSMVAELYRSMPVYLGSCESALLLDARDEQGKLSAFFVLERGAERFDTYLLGCHSKKHYLPHASDLLFAEMISLARKGGKPEINLGLGVNPGIRRFKTKWGGKPYLNYVFCESYYGPPMQLAALDALRGKL